MYNAYGNNVFKKYQVNMGSPYQVKAKKPVPVLVNQAPEQEARLVADEEENILEKARLEARKIIEHANREAEEMLAAAQERIMSHMLEVEQKAKEEGYRNGEVLAQEHYKSLLNEAEAIQQAAQEVYRNTVVSLESDIVETILEMGRKVIDMELSNNREVILGLIRKALLGISPSGEIFVHVCPDDYDFVQQNQEKLISGMKLGGELVIKKDPSLGKGGCLVETDFGTVDSSIETQLSEVEIRFRELIDQQPAMVEAAITKEEL